MAGGDAITAENFAEHLAALRERVEQRRRAIEANPPANALTIGGVFQGVPEPGKKFWEVMRAARRHEYEPIDPNLVVMCERAMARLGREYLDAARCGDTATLRAYIEEGLPASYQDKKTGENALHIAAGSQARHVLRLLLPVWEGYTVRDRQGRLSSELAYLYGEDLPMARLLGIKERKEAAQTASILRRRELSFD